MSYDNYTIPVFPSWKKSKSNQKLLTDKQVRDIRTKKLSLDEYSSKYNKSVSAIRDIQERRSYKGVK